MRTLYKRPRIDQITSELEIVQQTSSSVAFIFIDLFWYSIFFTFLLTSHLPTIGATILTFAGIYLGGLILYGLISLLSKGRSSNH